MIAPDDIREISAGRTSEDNETGERRYARVFRVMYSQATAGPGQAIVDQMVQRFNRYEEPGGFVDAAALATTGTAAPEDPENCFNHLVTIQYSTRWWDDVAKAILSGGTGQTGSHPGGGGSPDSTSPANPLARPAHYSWGTITVREVMEFDYRSPGVAVKNTAGVPFNPPYETERELQTLTVERNVPTFDQETARQMMDSVNDSSLRILGKDYERGMVRLKTWTADSQFESNVRFWTEHLVLWFKEGKLIPNRTPPELAHWRVILLNAGTKELRSGKLTNITRQGHPDADPWPLDSAGQALAVNYTDSQLIYGDFIEFPYLDFSILRLDP